jgi:hypothetical protein
MKAVTSTGKKRNAARAGFALAVASGLSPVLAVAASPVDQIESLMRDQQALQNTQNLQIQSLRQQLDSHAIENLTQDWQLAGGLVSAVLILVMGAWLLARWPSWQQQWQQARSKRQARPAQQREERSLPQEQRDAAFIASGLNIGEEIDHSGQGIVQRLVQQKKRRNQKMNQGLSKPAPDSEWLAQLDGLDSQFLADDALREYELRKTVGLISAEVDDLQKAEAEQSKAAGLDDVWHSMEEVLLQQALHSDDDKPELSKPEQADPEPSSPEPESAKPDAAQADVNSVDVNQEVQRVRKALHERRKQRDLQSLATQDNDNQDSEPSRDVEVAAPEEWVVPEESAWSDVQEPVESLSVSVRAMSDADTRLALAREFHKLGQIDEAAHMCEEVLASGTVAEQQRARQYLSSLPGR